MSRVVVAGSHNLYMGEIPSDLPLPCTFSDVVGNLKERLGILVLGYRPHKSDSDHLNPPLDATVDEGARLIYLAEGPVLEA